MKKFERTSRGNKARKSPEIIKRKKIKRKKKKKKKKKRRKTQSKKI